MKNELPELAKGIESSEAIEPEQPQVSSQPGFFTGLLGNLKQSAPHNMLSRDLLGEMKSFYKYEKPALEVMASLESEIRKRTQRLEILEAQWRFIQEQIEERKKAAEEKELEIGQAVDELQLHLKRLALFQQVPPSNYFQLANGRPVRSVAELLVALREVTDETFTHHIGAEHNDFASWIVAVLRDESLAGEMRSCGSRQSMIELLDKKLKAPG